MSDFKRISEIAKVRRGASPRPIDDPKYFGGDVGWIRIVDVTRSKKYLTKTEQYVSPLGESKSVKVDDGDLIMSICGTIGRPIIIKIPACIHDGFVQFCNLNNIETDYLFYILQFSESLFQGMGQPGTQVNLNTSLVSSHKFFCPQISEQHKIAEILTTVDNLIEQTEAAIAKYQAIKQGMMHDLFTRGVDANGHLRPPREEAPELYKESEWGWIPKEWEAKPLEQLLVSNPKNGYSPREVDEWEGIYMLGLGCLTPEGYKPLQLKFAPSSDRKISSALLSDGDILISRANTIDLVGLVGIYKTIGEKCIYPDLMMRLTPTSSILTNFFEHALQYQTTRRKITCLSQGTSSSMVKINARNVKSLIIPCPGIPEQDRIIQKLSSTISTINLEREKKHKYQTIKSGLMQDLLSGRVRVPTDLSPTQESPHAA